MAIVCELMHDSVYGILRKHKDLSILQRVKMAKDTAQGNFLIKFSNFFLAWHGFMEL